MNKRQRNLERLKVTLGALLFLLLIGAFLAALIVNGALGNLVFGVLVIGVALFLCYLLLLGFLEFLEQVSRWREGRAELRDRNVINLKDMELRIQTERDASAWEEQDEGLPDQS